VCAAKEYKANDQIGKKKLALLKKGMLRNYQQHGSVYNMPVTWCYQVTY
jgi:hypothetical protein